MKIRLLIAALTFASVVALNAQTTTTGGSSAAAGAQGNVTGTPSMGIGGTSSTFGAASTGSSGSLVVPGGSGDLSPNEGKSSKTVPGQSTNFQGTPTTTPTNPQQSNNNLGNPISLGKPFGNGIIGTSPTSGMGYNSNKGNPTGGYFPSSSSKQANNNSQSSLQFGLNAEERNPAIGTTYENNDLLNPEDEIEDVYTRYNVTRPSKDYTKEEERDQKQDQQS